MTRVATAAAVPAFVLGAAGPGAASGTPDDHWDEAFPGGSVMWNDYNTDNPAEDYDNLTIDNRDNDGISVRLIATNESTNETFWEHAYRGETNELDVGNVRKATGSPSTSARTTTGSRAIAPASTGTASSALHR